MLCHNVLMKHQYDNAFKVLYGAWNLARLACTVALCKSQNVDNVTEHEKWNTLGKT